MSTAILPSERNAVFEAPLTLPEERKAMADLYGALAAAMSKVQAVSKDSKNEYHKYKYASAESIITEARAAFMAHGLCIIPTESSIVPDASQGLILRCTYVLGHKNGGSVTLKKDWPIIPDRGRPLDKATASADTTSLAYLYRDVLQMPRVDSTDDMDHPSRDKARLEAEAVDTAKEKTADEIAAWITQQTDLSLLDLAKKRWHSRKHLSEKEKERLDAVLLEHKTILLGAQETTPAQDADQLTAMMDKQKTGAGLPAQNAGRIPLASEPAEIVSPAPKTLAATDKLPKPVAALYDELDAAEWSPQLAKLSEWESSLNAAAALHGLNADDYRLDLQTRWGINAYMKCPSTKEWKAIGEQIGRAVKDEATLARLGDARMEAAERLKIKL